MDLEPATVGKRLGVSSQTGSQALGASGVERDHARESDRATPAASGPSTLLRVAPSGVEGRPTTAGERVCRAADRPPPREALRRASPKPASTG
jgi:hypothetical protein